ncbi:MAG: TIM barrel protein [Acidobacteriaceae bacterium]|nr:TIM barrel protein [Acidobacteriaceae bacterium]
MKTLEASIGRRGFLAGSLVFGNLLRAALPSAPNPSANFPTDPRRRLSVSTYPFRSLIKTRQRNSENANAKLTLAEFAASIPDRFQVSGIEPWSLHFESTGLQYVQALGESFKKAGVHVVDIPVDASVQPCSPDSARRQASLETWRAWVDVAVAIGSPSIRVHLPETGADDCIAGGLKQLVDYAIQKSIVVNLENDDPKSEEAFRVVKVIEQVNSPFLRALPDFCNSRIVGDEAYNYRALTAMFAHAYNISHVKDEEADDGKVLKVDVARVFAIAKKAGYRGYFSMEWEGQGDPYDGTKRLIQQSLDNLS